MFFVCWNFFNYLTYILQDYNFVHKQLCKQYFSLLSDCWVHHSPILCHQWAVQAPMYSNKDLLLSSVQKITIRKVWKNFSFFEKTCFWDCTGDFIGLWKRLCFICEPKAQQYWAPTVSKKRSKDTHSCLKIIIHIKESQWRCIEPWFTEPRNHHNLLLLSNCQSISKRNTNYVTIRSGRNGNLYIIASTLTAIIFLHYRVATKMALEILGYTMFRVRLRWLVSLPLGVSKLVFAWLEGAGAIF